MKRKIIGLLLVGVLTLTGCNSTVSKSKESELLSSEKALAKNVIMIIPDGMSMDVLTLARWYNGGELLNVDSLATGLVRTYSSDAAIADSAPAGTAMATGHKSHTGYVGVLPDENTMPGMDPLEKGMEKKPIASVLEGAKLQGKSTGLVATCEIMHATPAGYSAHSIDRNDYNSIGEQQVYQDLDVVIAGGSKYLSPDEREDKEDLLKIIKEKEYNYVENKEDLDKVKEGKLWAMLADVALPYDMDKKEEDISLPEMTSKAIELLSKDEDGFFLMVEASKVDWAAHANDPIGLISDTLAFDETVGVALDFAKDNEDTVIVSATDHGNSGMTIGDISTNDNYDKLHISHYLEPLKKAKVTGEGIEKLLNEDRSNIVEIMTENFGITDLSEEEISLIKEAETGTMNYVVGPMIAKRASIGFTTNGHTGEDVPLYVYAPEKVKKLSGTVENTDIAKYVAEVLGFDLDEVTNKLFVNGKTEFEKNGAKTNLNTSDKENIVFEVTKGSDKLEFPVNKSYVLKNGKEVELSGVTVYNEIDFYVPEDAISLIK